MSVQLLFEFMLSESQAFMWSAWFTWMPTFMLRIWRCRLLQGSWVASLNAPLWLTLHLQACRLSQTHHCLSVNWSKLFLPTQWNKNTVHHRCAPENVTVIADKDGAGRKFPSVYLGVEPSAKNKKVVWEHGVSMIHKLYSFSFDVVFKKKTLTPLHLWVIVCNYCMIHPKNQFQALYNFKARLAVCHELILLGIFFCHCIVHGSTIIPRRCWEIDLNFFKKLNSAPIWQ